MNKKKCVFLDRDGVLNVERGDYTYLPEDFEVIPGVPEALHLLKQHGFLLVVITNQGGIAKNIYTKADMQRCHEKLQAVCSHILDAFYYAPAHPAISNSLSRKPDSLMLEKAIARFNIDPAASWFVGDQIRDVEAAQKVGIKPILITTNLEKTENLITVGNLKEAARLIVQKQIV